MINIGIIGLGYWGFNLYKAFSALPKCQVKAIADKNEARFTEDIDVLFSTDYKKILSDSKIDAVAIATPAETHFKIALDALDAGKAAFVEKPFTLNYQEAAILDKIAHARKQILMVDHLLRFHRAAEEMIRAVNAGEIGDIFYIHGQRIGGKCRETENVLWSLGPHDLSLVFALVDSPLAGGQARGGSYSDGPEGVVFADLMFENGIRARFHFSWMDRYKERRFVVVGSKGTIIFDDLAPEPLIFHPARKVPPLVFKGPRPLDAACSHFIDCVITGEKPLTNSRDATRIIEVLEALNLQLEASQ